MGFPSRSLPLEGDEPEVVTGRLVSDLHAARPVLFWTDLLATAVVGWTAFVAAVVYAPFWRATVIAPVVAAFALYRGLCFTHELTHLRRGSVPGFETAWNVLFGVPLLLPSFTYLGVHQNHHNLSTYGTSEDPEYLPFAQSRRLMFAFAAESSLVLPVLLLVRFLLLAPIGLVSARFHRWLEVRASSFAMNPTYRRTVSPSMARKMRRWEAGTLVAWATVVVCVYRGALPLRTLLLWYLVVASVSFLNTFRVLGAHLYETDGRSRSRLGQLRDSIDTPGGLWTELWAPVGLRYHALHHYFPGIPYHNLGAAYRRINRALLDDLSYRESTSPSLWRSLKKLYRKAKRAHVGTA